MQDYSEPRQKRNSRARERHNKRSRRREAMVTLRDDSLEKVKNNLPDRAGNIAETLIRGAHDVIWYITHKTSVIKLALLGVVGMSVLLVVSALVSNTIGANVWALNVNLAGMTVDEATTALLDSWENASIRVTKGEQLIDTVSPRELGLQIDAATMAEEAKSVGLSGIPFGVDIKPQFTTDPGQAQTYLLSIVEDVYVPPYDAGYRYENGQIIGVSGRNSEELDINRTMDNLFADPMGVYRNGRIAVAIQTTPPAMMDPEPYLEDARRYVNIGLTLTGYDPFIDEYQQWTSTPEEITRWLKAGPSGLTLREEAFSQFIRELNKILNSSDTPRYLDLLEVSDQMVEAIAAKDNDIFLRIRYLPTKYQIAGGDNGFQIGRKHGLPFRLIDSANVGLEWNSLSIGDEINIPSPDAVLPMEIVPTKRIVVDLDIMWLVAYENGEQVMDWPISIGMPDAPSSPGIFQILDKSPKAYGSSFSLCGASGCGQWEMDWFMSIYEVAPGLTNGFHGAVLLPNGGYLGGGNTQQASTFGCIMSENSNAERLYNWAEVGTVVEIISSQFPPRSDIGRQASAYIQQTAANYDDHRQMMIPVGYTTDVINDYMLIDMIGDYHPQGDDISGYLAEINPTAGV